MERVSMERVSMEPIQFPFSASKNRGILASQRRPQKQYLAGNVEESLDGVLAVTGCELPGHGNDPL